MKKDPYRLMLHLMPPTGWLNDPNGLCQYRGIYHVFYQYVPEDAKGRGQKCWGHAVSSDLIHWKDEGIFLYPDQAFDRDGVYSGCAWTDEEGIHLFYTGNVKEEGDYDYIHEGRKAVQVLVDTGDGRTAGEKKLLLSNADYPENCTCHVRDPKVWKEGNTYYMVLGARLDSDQGAVLIYKSDDLLAWKLSGELTSNQPFGYMWECPDYFSVEGNCFLSVSPQGLQRGEYENQNVYQSGYMKLGKKITDSHTRSVDETTFEEWDKGFDFYAPQTFLDERGRRILIGWMGLPDIEEEYRNPTADTGWQHAMTLPREITYEKSSNRLCQQPVEEFKLLRGEKKMVADGENSVLHEGIYEVQIDEIESDQCRIAFNQDLILDYRDGVFSIEFLNDTGAGRTKRRARIGELHDIRIMVDTSAVEIYVNHGSTVFTSRYYPANRDRCLTIECEKSRNTIWQLDSCGVSP